MSKRARQDAAMSSFVIVLLADFWAFRWLARVGARPFCCVPLSSGRDCLNVIGCICMETLHSARAGGGRCMGRHKV